MKLGTHVHYTKTIKFSYSAKPDCAWGGCGGHFPKWPLSQKLRGAEPSTLTVCIGFMFAMECASKLHKCGCSSFDVETINNEFRI